MAAAITRKLFPATIYCASVGVREGEPDPFVAAVMEEIGIDMSGHRATVFDELSDTSFDLVITMSPEAHHRAMELTRTQAFDVEYWPTDDPTAAFGSRDQRLDAYRRLRESLIGRIKERFHWTSPPGA